MNKEVLSNYVDKVFSYAQHHTYNRHEAEDLTQEIFYQACRSIKNIKDERKIEQWIFGVAKNVLRSFRRNKSKDNSMYIYNNNAIKYTVNSYSDEEEDGLYNQLVKEIIALSAIYREIIIMHYYEGISCENISQKLNIPVGTVKWRLSEGRVRIKKGWSGLMEDKRMRPKKLIISFGGEGNYNGINRPYPGQLIDNALAHNVLWSCYKKARSVEELAKITGIPAYYIEDCLDDLISKEAINKINNKYLTDFIILTKEYFKICNSVAKSLTKPLVDEFFNSLELCLEEIDFYKAGREKSDLIWLLSILAVNRFKNNQSCDYEYPERYNGYCWDYIAVEPEAVRINEISGNSNRNPNLKYEHHVFFIGYPQGRFIYMMSDHYLKLCRKIIHDQPIKEEDKELVSQMIKEGYLIKDNEKILVNAPIFTKKQFNDLNKIFDEKLKIVDSKFEECINQLNDALKTEIPRHLHNKMGKCITHSWILLSHIMEHAINDGMVERPQKEAIWDVLIEH